MAEGWAEVFGEIGQMADETGKQLIYLAGVCARLKASLENSPPPQNSRQALVVPEGPTEQRAAATKAILNLLRERHPDALSTYDIVATLAPLGILPQTVRSVISKGIKAGVLERSIRDPTSFRAKFS